MLGYHDRYPAYLAYSGHFMKRFQVSLLSLLLACNLVSIGASFYAQSDRKDLSIKIVEDDIDSVLFHVSITNISDEPIRLWEEWNTWGYFSLSFELFDMTGKSLGHIAKSQRRWTVNRPSFVEIKPGQSHEIDVILHPGVWDFPDKSLLNSKGAAEYRLVASYTCLLYTSPSPRDKRQSRMPSSA